MKIIAALLIILLCAFSNSAISADKADKSEAPSIKKSAKNKKNQHRLRHFSGLVKFLDVESGTVTVAGTKGRKTFNADETKLKELKLDDKVFIKYTSEKNRHNAVSISPAGEKGQNAGMSMVMTGEVKGVDASAGTITITGIKGESTFFAGQKILSDIKVGSNVYIRYADIDGKLTADSIRPVKISKPRPDKQNNEENK
jgi:Cu/Ag efflux protein CusF